MSAPKGTENTPPSQDEATERAEAVLDDDQELVGLLYTGGHTEYAHIYLAAVRGRYNGNEMLWLNYVWLSKPGAYDSDMWGDNGISIRLVDGMQQPLLKLIGGSFSPGSARYVEVDDDE
jgi:hypothetical protein